LTKARWHGEGSQEVLHKLLGTPYGYAEKIQRNQFKAYPSWHPLEG